MLEIENSRTELYSLNSFSVRTVNDCNLNGLTAPFPFFLISVTYFYFNIIHLNKRVRTFVNIDSMIEARLVRKCKMFRNANGSNESLLHLVANNMFK